MNVQELINLLQKVENKTLQVKIYVSQYNKSGSVAELDIDPERYGYLSHLGGSIVLNSQLPKDESHYTILVKRKI